MTPDEAAELLNVVPNANPEEILSKYQEAYSDFQIRLANAPTPTLKRRYESILQDLRIATETLIPGALIDARHLPAAQPSQEYRKSESQPPEHALKPKPASTRKPVTVLAIAGIAVFFATLSGFLLVKQLPFITSASHGRSSPVNTAASSDANPATLLIMTDLDCDWSLDGIPQGRLNDGGANRLRVSLGKHVIIAASSDGLDHFRSVVEVLRPQQEVATIELRNIRGHRLELEGAAEAKIERDKLLAESDRTRTLGYWLDKNTHLIWALRDRGSNQNWDSAVTSCRSSRLGGLSNWHLPDIRQLESLYDSKSSKHIRGGIQLSDCCVWSSTSDASDPKAALSFDFPDNVRNSVDKSIDMTSLCVTSVKR